MPIGAKSDLNALDHPAVKKAIREFAEELTELEGPVSPSRFASLVAKSFDMTGVKSEKAALIAKIPDKSVHKRDSEGFIFPHGVSPAEFSTWKRQDSGAGRDLQDISLVELANAMRDLCARVHGMPQAELFRQVSLAFGRARVGSVADARLSSALSLGLELGFLRDQDDLIEAVAN
jgi:hypothetical protein